MSYHVRIRHGGGHLLCEYLCPTHGRFDCLVIRLDGGDPPASSQCEKCGAESMHVTSAVLGRVKRGEVKRGKSDERPPGYLNTEPLADGMPQSEWNQQIDKQEFDERRRKTRDAMGIA